MQGLKRSIKTKFLDNVADLFNDLYYICNERYEEEENTLNKKDTQKFDDTKLKIADDYLDDFEEEDKQTDKKPDKKEPPKKLTKIDVKNLNKLINKEKIWYTQEIV